MQTGFKAARINVKNFRYVDDTTLKAESEEELKSLLIKVKRESEEGGLNLYIRKTDTASCPITSWQIDGKAVEMVADIFWRAPKSLKVVTTAKLEDAYSS